MLRLVNVLMVIIVNGHIRVSICELNGNCSISALRYHIHFKVMQHKAKAEHLSVQDFYTKCQGETWVSLPVWGLRYLGKQLSNLRYVTSKNKEYILHYYFFKCHAYYKWHGISTIAFSIVANNLKDLLGILLLKLYNCLDLGQTDPGRLTCITAFSLQFKYLTII